jgi:hypothetical protein
MTLYIQDSVSSEPTNMFDGLMDTSPTSSDDDDKLQWYLTTDVKDVKDGLMWWYDKHAIFS